MTDSSQHPIKQPGASDGSRRAANVAKVVIIAGLAVAAFAFATSDLSEKDVFEGRAISQSEPTPSGGAALGLQRQP